MATRLPPKNQRRPSGHESAATEVSSNSLLERISVRAVYSGDPKENAEPTNLTKMNPA